MNHLLCKIGLTIIIQSFATFSFCQLGLQIDFPQTVLFGQDTMGAGIKAFWLPSKGAFRAGEADKGSWNYDSMGHLSMAWGKHNLAKGEHATAWGLRSRATANQATAWGNLNEADSLGSTAWGNGNNAQGTYATVWGIENEALGGHATTWGQFNEAYSLGVTVWGLQNKAQGIYSTVWGDDNIARGSLGTAAGWNNISQSVLETVIGYYADTVQDANPLIMENDDHLFVVGNGTQGQRSNALALFKSGDLKVGRTLQLKAFDSPWGTESDDGVLASDLDHANSDLHLVANDNVQIDLDDFGTHTSTLIIRNGADQEIFRLDEAGNLEISGTLNMAANHANKKPSNSTEMLINQLEQENKSLRKENVEIRRLLWKLGNRLEKLEGNSDK